MRFCSSCFKDQSIIELINSQNIKTKGKCDFCKTNNVFTYSAEDIPELTEIFESFVDSFTLLEDVDFDTSSVKRQSLTDILTKEWSVFSKDVINVNSLIQSICYNIAITSPKLLKEPIVLSDLFDSEFVRQNTIIKNHSWYKFTEYLKYYNRFFTEEINVAVFDKIFPFMIKEYQEGIEFYRARFPKDTKVIPLKEMGAPPNYLSSEGRANSKGIRCLYLSSDIKTTFYEIKARTYDIVSIGTFKATKTFSVIDLKNIHNISPFVLGDKLSIYTLNRKILMEIGFEIAKPLKYQDSVLDYIPTQYISDYIKSRGYDGIEYMSTINTDGYNIAIFYPDIFECIEADLHEVGLIKYVDSKVIGNC